MAELILHHFDWSPYAEKVRVLLGIKGLAWRSVQIPMVMPKPDLTALTGGYRKTPVLQVGADVYCDTSLIALELERRQPEPTLFPDGGAGLSLALSPGRGVSSMPARASRWVSTTIAGRPAEGSAGVLLTHGLRASVRAPHLFGQVAPRGSRRAATGRRSRFLSARPGLADATAYYVLWMARGFVAAMGEVLGPFAASRAGRIACAPSATARAASSSGRRARDRASSAGRAARRRSADPLALAAGTGVTVTPDDYGKVPVAGELVRCSATRWRCAPQPHARPTSSCTFRGSD